MSVKTALSFVSENGVGGGILSVKKRVGVWQPLSLWVQDYVFFEKASCRWVASNCSEKRVVGILSVKTSPT